MDEINQIQNSNISTNMPPTQPSQPMDPAPIMPQVSEKKKSSWFLITIVIILAVGGFIWWYVGQMTDDSLVVEQPKIDKQAREDALISKDIEATDSGSMDAEFQSIDTDLNSL